MQAGAWLFRNRGWLPVPLLFLGVVLGPRHWAPGLVLMTLGEALRLWAVGHIGLPSRTRGDGVGALVLTGPYARVRNPLYVGNMLVFAGFGVLTWPAALVIVPLLAVHYHAIVAWEEHNLRSRLGEAYVRYCEQVPRWGFGGTARPGRWDGRRAFRSERSTLIVIGLVLSLVFLRSAPL